VWVRWSTEDSRIGSRLLRLFLLRRQQENVNMIYIIGRMAMMGKADRLPPTISQAQEFRSCPSGNCWTATHSIRKKSLCFATCSRTRCAPLSSTIEATRHVAHREEDNRTRAPRRTRPGTFASSGRAGIRGCSGALRSRTTYAERLDACETVIGALSPSPNRHRAMWHGCTTSLIRTRHAWPRPHSIVRKRRTVSP
jgi:hypothetical protein